MRILIVSTYFPPLNSIASLRPYSWAKFWNCCGHDVTVLTTPKHIEEATSLKLPIEDLKIITVPFPKWIANLKLRYHKNSDQLSNHSIIKNKSLIKKFITSFFYYLRNKKGILNTCRMPDFSDFWISPAIKAVENEVPWDIVISTAGPYSTHIVASRLKKRGQARFWVADYRDAWSDSRIYPGISPFNKLEEWLEKKIICRADLISTVSDPFATAYALKFPNLKVVTIENGFDPDDLTRISQNSIFPTDGKFRIVYTGSIYPGKQDPAPLFQAIDAIRNDTNNIHLLDYLEVVFIGPNQQYLQDLVAKYHLEAWIKFQGFISREDALRMQRDAHALLFLAWNDQTTDGVMTGKLFEYLHSKTPILSIGTHGIEASQKLIVEANAGVVYTDPIEIAEWLRNHLNFPIKQHTKIDPQLLNRYDRNVLASKLLDSCSQHFK